MAQKKDDGIPKISASSTKKEMLEAFNELKQQLEEKEESELKPEKMKEEIHKKEIILAADTLTADGTTTQINNLKTDIGKMLTQLSDKLENESSNYLKLKESIELKKKELKEIYDIEASAHALAALLETQKIKRREFETEMEDKRVSLENAIKQSRLDWEKEQKEHTEAIKNRDAEEKKTREREKEEFDYNFKREKQLSENAFKDQKEKIEKELAEAKIAFDKLKTETEKILNEREVKVKEREKLMDDLQKQVDEFPTRLETAVNKAIIEVTERLTAEAKKNEALLSKEYEGDKNVLKTKIEALEGTVTEQAKQITDLSARLEKSYGKVQEIAVKAIEGSSGTQKLFAIEQHLMERKSAQQSQSKES
jgi:hypothetical protein